MSNENMSLGAMLKANKQRAINDYIEKEAARLREEDLKFKAKKKEIETFFDNAKEKITNDIMNNKDVIVISTRGFKYDFELMRRVGKTELLGISDTKFSDIWYDFKEWLSNNELDLRVTDAHDGVGMESWTTLVITPKE